MTTHPATGMEHELALSPSVKSLAHLGNALDNNVEAAEELRHVLGTDRTLDQGLTAALRTVQDAHLYIATRYHDDVQTIRGRAAEERFLTTQPPQESSTYIIPIEESAVELVSPRALNFCGATFRHPELERVGIPEVICRRKRAHRDDPDEAIHAAPLTIDHRDVLYAWETHRDVPYAWEPT